MFDTALNTLLNFVKSTFLVTSIFIILSQSLATVTKMIGGKEFLQWYSIATEI